MKAAMLIVGVQSLLLWWVLLSGAATYHKIIMTTIIISQFLAVVLPEVWVKDPTGGMSK